MKDLNELTCEFFGLPNTDDPYRLLGISVRTPDSDSVKKAKRIRDWQWHAKPKIDLEEADAIKQHIKKIANNLLLSIPDSQPLIRNSEVEMTQLDRTIIATLISFGGWNSKSRTRLAAIAAMHSITVGGLMRILEALGDAARDGEGPLTMQRRSKIHMDRSWVSVPANQSKLSVAEDFVTEFVEKLTPDLRNPSPIMTINLSIFFAFLTLLAFALSLHVLFSTSDEVVLEEIPSYFDEEGLSEEILMHAPELFDQYPTFSVPNIGNQYAVLADSLYETSANLTALEEDIVDSLAHKKTYSPAWLTIWEEAIASISTGWVLAEPNQVRLLQDKIVQVLLASQGYAELSTLLLSFLEMPPLQAQDPSGIPAIVWRSGMVAQISCDQALPIDVRSTARTMQFTSLDVCDVDEARASSSLLLSAQLSKKTIFDDRYLQLWEVWLLVVDATNEEQVEDEILISAIQDLLNEEIDITGETNNRKVIGRLVKELQWARSVSTKHDVLSMYKDASFDSDDLYLLSQIFLKSGRLTWFADAYAVQKDDSIEMRLQRASMLEEGWPQDATPEIRPWALEIPIGFNEEIFNKWMDAYAELDAVDSTSSIAIAEYRFLNEIAVCIWLDRTDLALQRMESRIPIEPLAAPTGTLRMPSIDGKWSEEFRKSAATEKRLELIDDLRSAGYENLGLKDASKIASAALTNYFASVRNAATELIVDSFSSSKSVAIALVKSYEESVSTKRATDSTKQVAKLIANLTEAILPERSNLNWSTEARRALVQHALTVDASKTLNLDITAVELSDSYLSEYLLLRPSALPPSREVSPLEAIQSAIEAWEETTVLAFASNYQPSHYKTAGILQSFLRSQLAYVHVLQIEEARWRGRDFVAQPVLNGLIDKGDSWTVVQQILAVEKFVAEHWRRIFMDLYTQTQEMDTE